MLESVREAGVGYRLLNLLAFYKGTVGQLAGVDSPVLEALSECTKNANDTFRHAMKREVRFFITLFSYGYYYFLSFYNIDSTLFITGKKNRVKKQILGGRGKYRCLVY